MFPWGFLCPSWSALLDLLRVWLIRRVCAPFVFPFFSVAGLGWEWISLIHLYQTGFAESYFVYESLVVLLFGSFHMSSALSALLSVSKWKVLGDNGFLIHRLMSWWSTTLGIHCWNCSFTRLYAFTQRSDPLVWRRCWIKSWVAFFYRRGRPTPFSLHFCIVRTERDQGLSFT